LRFRELEAKSFGAYFPFVMLFISPKLCLKTPSGLGGPSIESFGLFQGEGAGTTDPVQVVPLT
jgi:hypothetical protein